MLDHLSDKLQSVFKNLKGEGKLTEKHISAAMREIRIALLEADVNYAVAKSFIKRVKQLALGQDVLDSLTPGQQVVKIVRDEMVALLGGEHEDIKYAPYPPTVIMLVGLQGSGKTTTIGKLGVMLRKEGKSPLLVPADVYRPAAIDQLKQVAKQIDMPVFDSNTGMKPEVIAKKAVRQAKDTSRDVILLDTAGRLHIDDELMDELRRIKKTIDVNEILFVADAGTGQDAVNSATSFDNALDVNGVVLTKMDGDMRGGAALSIREVTGKPIKFIGVGEKFSDIEAMHPDRLVSRILGMGDVLSLIEKAQESFDEEDAQEMEKKLRKNSFTLEDFRKQIRQIKKLGPLEKVLGMIPGVGNMAKLKEGADPGKEMKYVEAILNSMTNKERANHKLINGSRRKRIAKGSGTTVQKVNQVLRQFVQARKMMKQFGKGTKGGPRDMRKLQQMFR
jgi:signal recognition particle subunit SRP54